MSDLEREARRVGLRALDDALIALGASPLRENSDFRATDPDVGGIPAIVLDRSGVAPFRFTLGLDLDIWIGPLSEVVAAPISAATQADLQRQIERLLRSVVTCRRGKRSMTIGLQLPDEEPWLRSKSTARAWRRRLSRRIRPMSSI
jgi:hypothetical protein